MTIAEEFGVIDFLNDNDRGTALLPEFLKDSQRINDIINAILPEIQELHDAQFDVYSKINLNDAVGLQLDDIFGEILDLARTQSQTDEDYRTALKARISSFARSGEISVLKQAARDLTGATDVSLLEVFTMTLLMHIYVGAFEDIPNAQFISDTLGTLKQAGVFLDVGMSLASSEFKFSESLTGGEVGEGFSENLDGTGGGTFARLLTGFVNGFLTTEAGKLLTTESGTVLLINYNS